MGRLEKFEAPYSDKGYFAPTSQARSGILMIKYIGYKFTHDMFRRFFLAPHQRRETITTMTTSGMLSVVFFVLVTLPVSLYAQTPHTSGEPAADDAWLKINWSFGFDLVSYGAELGEKIRTTPVHPSDSLFLSGSTTTANPDDGLNFDFAPKLGISGSVGSGVLRLIGGASVRFNWLSTQDGYREGMHSVRQQVSDTRPSGSGSFVFTQVIPEFYTITPSVGVEWDIANNVTLEASVGFPYMEWEVQSGHDRVGLWETVQTDSWSGFGMRYSAGTHFTFFDNIRAVLQGFYEEFEPDFAGEEATISGAGGYLGFSVRF